MNKDIKLKPRKMWANYYPDKHVAFHHTRRKPRYFAHDNAVAIAVPVAVIPLVETEALRKEIRDVINWWFDGESDYKTCLEKSTEGVLRVLSVLPKSRAKKGRK